MGATIDILHSLKKNEKSIPPSCHKLSFGRNNRLLFVQFPFEQKMSDTEDVVPNYKRTRTVSEKDRTSEEKIVVAASMNDLSREKKKTRETRAWKDLSRYLFSSDPFRILQSPEPVCNVSRDQSEIGNADIIGEANSIGNTDSIGGSDNIGIADIIDNADSIGIDMENSLDWPSLLKQVKSFRCKPVSDYLWKTVIVQTDYGQAPAVCQIWESKGEMLELWIINTDKTAGQGYGLLWCNANNDYLIYRLYDGVACLLAPNQKLTSSNSFQKEELFDELLGLNYCQLKTLLIQRAEEYLSLCTL